MAGRCFGTEWFIDVPGGRGHGVLDMVTPSLRMTVVLLVYQTWQICHVQFCLDKRLGK